MRQNLDNYEIASKPKKNGEKSSLNYAFQWKGH